MARFCDLPESLVIEILLWLPADYLITLKCVSKWWYGIINDPTFVANHLEYTKKRSSTSILFKYLCCHEETRKNIDVKKLLTVSNNDIHSFKIDEDVSIPRFCKRNEHWTGPLGAQCNGFLCIADNDEGAIMLCNPVTKQSKVLSTSCIVQDGFRKTDFLGFGYDSRANDYKIIRVVSFQVDEFIYLRTGPSRAELYSLRADSWREIKGMEMEMGRCMDSEEEAYCGGVYYWLVRGTDKAKIIAFDMCKEEFHTIQMPDEMQRLDLRMNLAVWNESVAVLMYPMWLPRLEDPGIPYILMWVMSKGSPTWTMHQTIRLCKNIRGPLAFWKDDELLLDDKNYRVVSYNLHTQRFVDLPLENVMWCRATVFVKTLVPLNL
ncbi:hypothetical protein FNV43_RR04995 [Rhamnella rubrinervis]|uniref:F-box domain-containing protein n=1 Tax=Rhamnella rubrinervis TaxID=2594499 RepID=A0A8K0HKM7_9ROSA|nr:hypothetical protein FNV43_RR04995 [Rhamnella rubrinervis]